MEMTGSCARAHRRVMGLTIKRMACIIGVSESTLKNFETSRMLLPRGVARKMEAVIAHTSQSIDTVVSAARKIDGVPVGVLYRYKSYPLDGPLRLLGMDWWASVLAQASLRTPIRIGYLGEVVEEIGMEESTSLLLQPSLLEPLDLESVSTLVQEGA